MTNLIAISDARMKLPTLVDRVNKYLDRFLITVNGQPKAAVLSIDELESLEETANILSIPGALKAIKQGAKEVKAGKGMPLHKFIKNG